MKKVPFGQSQLLKNIRPRDGELGARIGYNVPEVYCCIAGEGTDPHVNGWGTALDEVDGGDCDVEVEEVKPSGLAEFRRPGGGAQVRGLPASFSGQQRVKCPFLPHQ